MESKRGSQTDGNYKTPQIIIPVKLPLAPIAIVSTSGNATVSTRRGSAIFSPTQTLDPHGRPPPQLHRQPPLHLQLPLVYKDPTTPDPDPAPAVHGASNSRATPPSPDLPPPAAVAESGLNDTCPIRYRECLKNHAASMGGHVVDGCGEFMSSGAPEALRCAACDCHRNFHRKELVKVGQPPQTQIIHPFPNNQEQKYQKSGGDAAAEYSSCSEDLNMLESISGHAAKKRFRTKFSKEQKDRMQEFATKLDWRIHKQEDDELQRFCGQIGVKRQVFKVWMHNNKQAMKRKLIN
ncbi:zinc-finger homeodomain protein 2-like [Henckelia pumila]|uniref:zinc-finger homeodomain protein 2-like n=1 Tax=Henckelia pumila TaxID=405737 RepID=UPI003C6DDD73